MAENNPYIGPASFGEKDRSHFFGRDDEARELSYLLIARRAVLLYAQSGAGKTSLLQAKVVPELRDSGEMNAFPITRVSGPAEGSNVYVANALAGLKLAGTTLTEALAPLFAEAPGGEEQIPHLLVFDQFEEIFTFHAEQVEQRLQFFEQLRDCLDAYPRLGLLLSMREDYLAEMDSVVSYLPDRLRTRMRMERLSDHQAEIAIAQPAAMAGKPFDAGVARKLTDDLRRIQAAHGQETAATDDDHALGKYVEPVQLQIVCQQLWSKLPDDAKMITAEQVETLARVDDALTNFYRESLAAVRTAVPTLTERTLRAWFTEHLITSANTRGMVYRGKSDTEGLPNGAVDVLAGKYIVRADARPSGTWYELTHDRLLEPIVADNLEWRANYKNPVADALARGPEKLLSGSGLADAIRYAQENPLELTQAEKDFLDSSKQAAMKRRIRRRIAVACAVAAIVVLAVVARYLEVQNAELLAAAAAEKVADRRKDEAERAKDDAERAKVDAQTDAAKAREETKMLSELETAKTQQQVLQIQLAQQKSRESARIAETQAALAKAQRKSRDRIFIDLLTKVIRFKVVVTKGSVPGEIKPLDPAWTALVTKKSSPFLIARSYDETGGGRIIAAGHDSFLSYRDSNDSNPVYGTALLWLQGDRPARVLFLTGPAVWAPRDQDRSAFASEILPWGFQSKFTQSLADPAVFSDVGVLVIGNSWGAFDSRTMTNIVNFVNHGGGLLAVGLGWSWNDSGNGQIRPIEKYPMNQLFANFGAVWNTKVLE